MKAARPFFRFLACLRQSWTWQMAWRDSRTSRRRLLLYGASIVLGIGALTAISSLGQQMRGAIAQQSKALLGADLVVTSRDPFTPEQEEYLRSLGGEQAREIAFPSMIQFLKNEGTRLVQIRALEGEFPFYGEFETVPPAAVTALRARSGALVEQNLLDLFEAAVGDRIKVGELILPVAGELLKVPGETVAFGTIAPRVYLPLHFLKDSSLLGEGSLARYKIYFRFGPEVNMAELEEQIRPALHDFRMSFDTVAERQRDLGRAMDNLYHFLNLIGFVALLLGGVGVASGIHVHIKQRLASVAVLRCLGCDIAQSFAVYFAQALALGVAGAGAGVALGIFIQMALPSILADFIPMQFRFELSPAGLIRGLLLGLGVCLLFALLPLLPVRRISPLAAIRSSVDPEKENRRDPLMGWLYAAIAIAVIVFGMTQSRRWEVGIWFGTAIVMAFLLLFGTARALMKCVRLGLRGSWPYVWRQGLSNLYRPNNRTALLVLSLGLGSFLVLTLFFVHKNLLLELFPPDHEGQGNAVLFDIQTDQKSAVMDLLRTNAFPVLEAAPIVSMRLQSINGRSTEEIRRDRGGRGGRWAFNREYRSTFRANLVDSERLIAGQWHERVSDPSAPVPVSLEEGIAESLNVGLGDELTFDVQGVPVKTRVASLREVEWRRLSPNFFVVFPMGAIDEAPAFYVMLTRVESSERSALLQREVFRRFPNVSAVDLRLVLQTLDEVLGKIGFVIQFMTAFTLGTGFLVLLGAIATGRFQRIQESVLLRTLGASQRQILQILAAEYAFLGLLAAAAGIGLAVVASWALAVWVFKIKFYVDLTAALAAILIVTTLTLATGLQASRGVARHPPLTILRDSA